MRSILIAVRLIPILFLGAVGASRLAACGDSSGPGCCKVCTGGKACGDTCIAKTDTCTKGAGCACNGLTSS